MQNRVVLLLGLLTAACSFKVLATEFDHVVGLSYQQDRDSSSEVQPKGYGLFYQLSINEKWALSLQHGKSESQGEPLNAREELSHDHSSQFTNLGLSYQTNDYYLDIQSFDFSSEQQDIQVKPLGYYQNEDSGFGVSIGMGRFVYLDNFSFEYGVSLSGSQADIKSLSIERINNLPVRQYVEGVSQQLAASLSTKASYFIDLESWALSPYVAVNVTEPLAQNDEYDNALLDIRLPERRVIRRGVRNLAFITQERSIIADFGLDLMLNSGISVGVIYSVSQVPNATVDTWLAEISYAF